MTRVTILQSRLFHYRVPLFEHLRRLLSEHGVELHLVHGQPSAREASRRDEGHLAWAHRVRNRYFQVGGVDLLMQPLPRPARDAELVVLMQENRILSNYGLLAKRKLSGRRLAWWGHGRNLQSQAPDGWRERWKAACLHQVDWWFGYTPSTVAFLTAAGFDTTRITCLNNAIDVSGFQRELAAVGAEDLEILRYRHGIDRQAIVAVHCGSLYADKRLDVLIESGDRVHRIHEDFRCIVIGDGPEARRLKVAERRRPWLRWVGAQTGAAKAGFFKLAQLHLHPGGVGLHALDAFSAGLPMVTLRHSRHGPEFDYLRDRINARIVDQDDATAFADTIVELLGDEAQRAQLATAAQGDAGRYTVEAMATNYCQGLLACLASPQPTVVHSRHPA